ncbi:hypothetical protein Nepgr_027080 [Nepenthes gracilis]|uniref:Protein Lines C-terminal domain-containing protein n=1 Tax=Nepenthes gracilis TaxID=150966 RepID=A0AAD3T9D9_NEPGR|nr:hypothetical protein Nepgr_027080 [Nepenthes gracilis]
MSGCRGDDISRFFCLIDECLRPYKELELVALAKDQERHLLISLSQVLREIQRCTDELDSGSVDDSEEFTDNCGSLNPHSQDHNFLTKIVTDLVVLLAAESRYVQHLAGNILVAISEFIASSGSNWDETIKFLCACFEITLSNTLSNSSASWMNGVEKLNCNERDFIILNSRLKHANWHSGAGIILILRKIVKFLKGKDDRRFGESFVNSLSSCLSNVSWDLLDNIPLHCKPDYQIYYSSHLMNLGEMESRIMFLGNLVQLFCSLIKPSGLAEATSNSGNKSPILHIILNLVPKVSKWCLGKPQNCDHKQILPYFRHKTLMLMTRISFQINFECPTLFLWLQLLHEHCEDLLLQPMPRLDSSPNDCLEGSPFLSSLSDWQTPDISSRHLQGRAVFLFLRCTISLMSMRGEADLQCICGRPNACLMTDINTIDCCPPRRGLLELYNWLRWHLPLNMPAEDKMNREKCITFAKSFIAMYMHQDDVLFEVLLLLFDIPSCAKKQILKVGQASQEAKEDALFHVSSIFNPLLLFHVFLAGIRYDNQLLLDYLISKDTGIRCAEYLLRCLRAACNSWDFFVEISAQRGAFHRRICKRRKVYGYGDQDDYGSKCFRMEEAKACLLSLRDTVRKIHRRNLFPYNPEVLLQRLTRFEELCNVNIQVDEKQ